jgi:hypothetical protein
MKYLRIALSVALALSFTAHVSAAPQIGPSSSKNLYGSVTSIPSKASAGNMVQCDSGTVVAISHNIDGFNDWGFWLKGNTYGLKFYRAYNINTDTNSGRAEYITVMEAKAIGAQVNVYDDNKGSQCNPTGSGSARGTRFDSISMIFP